MTDDFAAGIRARLQELSGQQPPQTTQEDAHAPLAPLHTRLQKLLDQIPDIAKREGVSLLDLQARLRGRKGGMPHVGELGAAMRRLGWQRRRTWSDQDAAFSSKWYPKDRS